jgi:hypothetical protein
LPHSFRCVCHSNMKFHLFFDLTNNLFLIVETVLNEGRPLQTRFTNHSINIGNFEAQIYQSFVLDLLSIGKMQFTNFLNYVTHRVLYYMNMSINLQILWVQITVLLTLVTCFNSTLIKHVHCVSFRVFFKKKHRWIYSLKLIFINNKSTFCLITYQV